MHTNMALHYKRCHLARAALFPDHKKLSPERHTRDKVRHTVERFWYPFSQGNSGQQLSSYNFRENLDSLRTPDFTCQVNGVVGGARLLEDFFSVLLIGFDIVSVTVENKGGSSIMEVGDLCNYRGHYAIAHTRPFLGWQPPSPISSSEQHQQQLSGLGAAIEDFPNTPTPSSSDGYNYRIDALSPSTRAASRPVVVVPFSTHVECGVSGNLLSHMVLRTPVMECIAGSELWECPSAIKECIGNGDALKMLAMLCRAKVNPSIISTKTLLSATQKSASWTSAMGIL